MRKTCILAMLVLATLNSISAQTDADATKSKVIALEQLRNQAYKAGDTKALDTVLDNAIVLVNDDGSVQGKAEFLASVKGMENGKAYTRRELFVDPWIFKAGTWVRIGTNATPVLY